MILVEADTPNVSSTDIRRRARAGEDLTGLVPAPVAAFISAPIDSISGHHKRRRHRILVWQRTQPRRLRLAKLSAAKSTSPRLPKAISVAIAAAQDRKATGVVVLDLRKAGAFTDYFLMCSGSNPRQVQAIADAVEEALKHQKQRPSLVEGYARAEWILLDYFDFVIHVFSKHARDFTGSIGSGAAPRGTNSLTSRDETAWAGARPHNPSSQRFSAAVRGVRRPLRYPLAGAVCEDAGRASARATARRDYCVGPRRLRGRVPSTTTTDG